MKIRPGSDSQLPTLTNEVVVLARRTAAGTEYVVVGDGALPVDPELSRAPERVEHIAASVLAATLRKVRKNASALPGFALAARALDKGADAQRPAPLMRSWWTSRIAADAALAALARLHRFTSKQEIAVEHLSETELSFIECWFTWSVTHGEHLHRELACALVEGGLSFQLALFHAVQLQRSREDVEGMLNWHAPATVAMIARTAFQHVARARAAAQGVPASSEEGLCWSTRGAQLSPSWLGRGFSPDPKQLDTDLGWLRKCIDDELEQLRQSWQFRLFWGASNLEVHSNTAPPQSPPVAAKVRGVPRSKAELDESLVRYGTSAAELLARVPALSADSAVALVGSVAEGLGHPRSDLDLIVLVSELPEHKGRSMSIASGHFECYAGVTSTGHSVCIEYLSDLGLSLARGWFEGCESALTGTGFDSDLDGASEILRRARSSPIAKLAQRAAFGLNLRQGPAGERWRAAFPATRYAEVLTESHLVEASRQELRARRWLAAGELLAANCAARLSWEHTLLALLSSRQHYVWSSRWIVPWLKRALDATTAEAFIEELFPRPLDAGYVDRVSGKAARLRQELERRSAPRSKQSPTGVSQPRPERAVEARG